MKYYKVLRRNWKDQLVSCYIEHSDWAVIYLESGDGEQQWSEPKVVGSKLFVFTDLNEAEYWAASGVNAFSKQVWRVEVEGIGPCDEVIPSWWNTFKWREFWEDPAQFVEARVDCNVCPAFTAIADRVLLVERARERECEIL